MKTAVYNQEGEKVGEALLPKDIFDVKLNSNLVHQVLVAQSANQRQGSAHTKTKGEVRGGGRKPWRQKGTGRARHSSIRSPLWRGGGVVFGPRKDKNWKQKINRKMRRQALLMVLSQKAREGEVFVLDDFKLKEAKTKEMFSIIKTLRLKIGGLAKGTLLISLPRTKEVFRAVRNIAGLGMIETANLSVLNLLSFKNVLLTKESISLLKKVFPKKEETEENAI